MIVTNTPGISTIDGHAAVTASIAMTNSGFPLTGSISAGFTIGFIEGYRGIQIKPPESEGSECSKGCVDSRGNTRAAIQVYMQLIIGKLRHSPCPLLVCK
jgi:hypothetical protein